MVGLGHDGIVSGLHELLWTGYLSCQKPNLLCLCFARHYYYRLMKCSNLFLYLQSLKIAYAIKSLLGFGKTWWATNRV